MNKIKSIEILDCIFCFVEEDNKTRRVYFPKDFCVDELIQLVNRMCDIRITNKDIVFINSQGVYINGINQIVVDNLACKEFADFWQTLEDLINDSLEELFLR